MRVAIYARVSTESQEARGTIGSQLELLRKRVTAQKHELVAEFRDAIDVHKKAIPFLPLGRASGNIVTLWHT